MAFIELHYQGNPRLIAVDKISAIGCNNKDTFIWLNGDPDCLYVDESYNQIKDQIRNLGFLYDV